MLHNCENAFSVYIRLFDLLTTRQRLRLIELAKYKNELDYLANTQSVMPSNLIN